MLSIYDIFETSFRLLGQHLWQASQKKFADTVELIQYNAALAMTSAIKGTSEEKLYNELYYKLYNFYNPMFYCNYSFWFY